VGRCRAVGGGRLLDDFEPIIHELPGRTIKLWAVADVHIGAKEANLHGPDGFEGFLKKVAQDDDSYLVIVGDLLNNAVRSSISDVYAEVLSPSAALDYAVSILQPVADKILGVVGGNHERRSRKEVDLDPLYGVCSMLRRSDGSTLQDVYRPSMAFMRIVLANGNTRDQYAIMLTHGKTLNKRKQFVNAVEGIDAAITAHTHQPDVMMPARIRFSQKNKISVNSVVSLCACSWLESGGYSLSGMYLPQATSRPQCLVLEFAGTNSRKGRISVSW